jgi:hypothetical protein
MRASKGAFTHEEIMRLPWRVFETYLDAFTWLLREESEDGQKENKRDDLRAMTQDPRFKDRKDRIVRDVKEKLKRVKKV